MISRFRRYLLGSYPPVLSALLAVCWAVGVTGLFATVDPHRGAWRPDAGTALGALTIALDMLLMRIVDDIRDLPYDRVRNPRRPLAAGVISSGELMGWYGLIALLLLALNAGRGTAALVLALQLGYALLLLAADRWLRWPDPGRLVVTLVLSAPVQLLLHLYLYLNYLRSAGHPFDGSFWLALVIAAATTLHLELAKKITREPAPGERSYVTTFGVAGTVRAAMVSAFAAAGLLLAARPATAGTLLPVAPLALPVVAWWRFRRPGAGRWDVRFALWFLLSMLVSAWAITGVLSG